MNDLCPGCKKAPHPGGCKLPPLPSNHKPPLVDPDYQEKRQASLEGREWKPVPKEEGVLGQSYHPDVDDNPNVIDISGLHPAMADLLRECIKIQGSKGRDYTEGSNDRLNNFREAGVETDTPMEKVWYVYFFKHWKAVRSWVRFGQVESEPIRGRIVDCINYLLLLWLIVREKDPNQD